MKHLSRLRIISWFNEAKAAASKIAVIGIGGSGCPAATMAARSGFCRIGHGHMTLVDRDEVAEENLNRDFHANEISVPKAHAAMRRILADIPDCDVRAIKGDVLLPSFQATLESIIMQADTVIHATDDRAARHHVTTVCRRHKKIMVDVGVSQTLMEFHVQVVRPDSGSCCECVTRTTISFPKENREGDCTASFMPTIMAAASFAVYVVVVPLLMGHGKVPGYLAVNLATFSMREIDIPVHPECSVCHPKEASHV